MGFLNFNKATPNQNHIIYTDNVRRKSSFSIIVSATENENNDFQEISKHIQTFEETATGGKETGNVITDKNGNFMVITELGANFVYRENLNGDAEDTATQTSSAYKWTVFISAFLILMIDMGFVFSFGTLLPAILETYKESRASSAAVQSVFTGIGPSSGIFTGVLVQRFGPRKCGVVGGILFSTGLLISFFATSTVYLQLSYGVVSALGFSLIYISANQILSQLFKGQARVICLAILSGAPGVGGSLYPVCLDWLTQVFGLNGTFLLLGGVMMNTIPLTMLWDGPKKPLKPGPARESIDSATESIPESSQRNFCKTVLETIRYKPFLFIFLGLGLTISTINIYGILAMDILTSNGLSIDQSLNAVIISSATSIPARLIPGFMSRIKRWSSLMTPVLATLLGAAGMLMLMFTTSFYGNVIASGIIGICRGCGVGSMSVVTLKVLDITRFSTGLGLIFGVVGVITTITGPLYGFLRDINGSYTIPLLATTVALLAGCIFCSVSLVLQSRVKAKRNRERSMSIFTVTRF